MIVGSVANGFNLRGFCAGSHGSPAHQRRILRIFHRGPSAPCRLRVGGHQHLQNTPSILSTLQENVCAILSVLDRVEAITIPTYAASPIIHIYLWSAAMLSAPAFASAEPPDPATPAPRGASSSGILGKEACCRASWAGRSRKACGPIKRGDCAGRNSSRRVL
ncbi:hypothetical protein EDB83DRAFT_1780442 [Lactarius deliciosus]|nr:hypothetical protein EDB83DRAFT_1780442 [Lactarius deliciosus]